MQHKYERFQKNKGSTVLFHTTQMTYSDLNSTPHYNQIYFKGGSHRPNVTAARMRYFLYVASEKSKISNSAGMPQH